MDGQELGSVDGALLVDGLSNDVHDSSQSSWTDGHHNSIASVVDLLSSDETFGGVESDGSDVVATQVLGDFQYKSV